MKRLLFYLLLIILGGTAKSQNVGINTANPQTHLDIHGNNTRIQLTDDATGSQSTITRYTNRLEISPPDIFQVSVGGFAIPHFVIRSNGYIGLGNNAPAYPLTLQTAPGVDNWGFMHTNGNVYMGSFIYNSGIAEFGTRSAHPLYLFTNNVDGPPAIAIDKGGFNVGFATASPVNHLQVGSIPGFSGNDLAIGNGTQGMAFTQYPAASTWYSNVNFSLIGVNGGNGYLGIGTSAPANSLQVGGLGASGYAGNHLAFGNGAQASGIAQKASIAQWYSTTDIALMPRGTGHGRVGINTTTPGFPLEVDDYVDGQNTLYTYLNDAHQNVNSGIITPMVSISAEQNVEAAEFDAYSDARIKDIIGVTDNEKDLQTLKAIQITDYTLKDKVRKGNKPYKKVIAQQVETVYPQVVSKHTDFIPNVYQLTQQIKKTDMGMLLHFENSHHLTQGAKRIKLLSSEENVMKKYEIVSILTDKDVIINAPDLKGDKVFVFGEEVSDFRTVDYEGLTTLAISATQELYRQLSKQQTTIEVQNEKIRVLAEKLTALTSEINNLQQK